MILLGSSADSVPLLLLVIVAIGILHTIVPDHWVPITVIARQRKWTKGETARAAAIAGFGHVVTTLILGLIVWVAGVAFASTLGHYVNLISSLALIAFGAWVGIGSYWEMRVAKRKNASGESIENAKPKNRTALLLILGSSPMVEGIPVFFAASKYGIDVIILMSVLFGLSTIATYVVLSTYSAARMQKMKFAAFEEYGEVLSGAIIALLGLVFLVFPIL